MSARLTTNARHSASPFRHNHAFAIEQLGQDLRHGARMLGKNPGFTAVAALTLTLGIGATTAIFSVLNAVLLRRLPYREPQRLVSLYEDRTRDGFPRKEFTPANYADCKTQTQVFAEKISCRPSVGLGSENESLDPGGIT